MRTRGTFQEIYRAAREYYISGDIKDRPMNPVVRLENGKWVIESGLEPQQDTEFECTLGAFDDYFYEAYKDIEYLPSEGDVADFMTQFTD